MDFDKIFIHLLRLTLHYFDQRCKQEVYYDVTFYLYPASAGGTKFTNGLLINQISREKQHRKLVVYR